MATACIFSRWENRLTIWYSTAKWLCYPVPIELILKSSLKWANRKAASAKSRSLGKRQSIVYSCHRESSPAKESLFGATLTTIFSWYNRELTILFRQKFISTIVLIIVFTTSLFTVLVVREVHDLQNYMGYVAQNGKSALFHEESINQSIATKLSREFYRLIVDVPSDDSERAVACQQLEIEGNIYGFNLLKKNRNNLEGTLQTRNSSCNEWAGNISALSIIDTAEHATQSKYSFSTHTGYTFRKIRYYVDLTNNYIYINQLISVEDYAFNNWLEERNGGINIARIANTIPIDDNALKDLMKGETTLTHIYQDGYTRNNIISILTPVFLDNELKGIQTTDINIDDLAVMFNTVDRQFLWKFLYLYITDNENGSHIVFNEPYITSYTLISYKDLLAQNYTLHVNLDAAYLIIANLWLLLLYIFGTFALCRYAHKQLIRQNLLLKDNVTDTMTGLYNRKVFTPIMEHEIRLLVDRFIPVTVIAIDCDGLKKINDSFGHHMGDKAIQTLGMALHHAIRKSDYGIRLGGDEFCLILIDNTLNKARNVVTCIEEQLFKIDQDKLVAFSWGAYQLQPGDTLEGAMLKADELLYLDKRSKYKERR